MMDDRKWLAAEEASVRCFRPRYFARRFSGGNFASVKMMLVGVIFLRLSANRAAVIWMDSNFWL